MKQNLQDAAFQVNKNGVMLAQTEIKGIDCSFSVDLKGMYTLVWKLYHYCKGTAHKNAQKALAQAQNYEWAAYFIEQYGLQMPTDGSEYAFFKTFHLEVRDLILKRYEFYLHKGFIEFVQNFPEYKQYVINANLSKNYIERQYLPEQTCLTRTEIAKVIGETLPNLQLQINSENEQIQKANAHAVANAQLTATSQQERAHLSERVKIQGEISKNDTQAPIALQERNHAILEFLNDPAPSVDLIYTSVSPQAQQLLAVHCAPAEIFQRCTGNKLQHALHTEFNCLLQDATGIPNTQLQSMIVENLVVGQEFTHAGHISMGYRLADLCHVLIGYAHTGARFSHAVVRGAWYSVCQWSNAIAHPMQTSQRIAAALDTTGRALAVIIEENIQMALLRCEIALLRHIDADLAEQKLILYAQKSHEYYDRVHACMQECTRACAGLSVEQAGELTGQLLVDSYLINRMISVASYVKKCAHTHAREVFQTLSQSKQTKILAANKLQSAETVASKVGAHEPPMVKNQVSAVEKTAAREIAHAFDIARYEPSIGNIDTLAHNYHLLENIPGFQEQLKKIETCGLKTSLPNQLSTARGTMYELEEALYEINRGEQVVSFGKRSAYKNITTGEILNTFDIDIETTTKMIECKSWTWANRTDQQILNLKASLKQLQKVAAQHGKIFEFHSKNKLPENLRQWLIKKRYLSLKVTYEQKIHYQLHTMGRLYG